MTRRQLSLYLVLVFILFLSNSCTIAPGEDKPTSSPTLWALTPYYKPITTATIGPTDSDINLQSTAMPQPSATPFLYEIQKNDTLSVIAYRHSITLDDILVANPGIDPNFLSIGTTIVIPIGEGNLAIPPTLTPFSVKVNQPQCYPTADGGLWCLALVNNGESLALENITASITLLSANGDLLAQKIALPPTNKVAAESSIPITAFFPAPVPPYQSIHVQILTALPVNDKTRYLETKIHIEENILSSNFATLRGTIEIFSAGDISAHHIIIAAIAYDEDANPIGIRKWETTIEPTSETMFPFEIRVFSLGPPIFEVEIISEARP